MVNYKSEESRQKILDALKKGSEIEHIEYQKRVEDYNSNPKFCLNCNSLIEYSKRYNKFCSQNCAATFNNKAKRKDRFCLICNKKLIKSQEQFCSGICSQEYRKKIYIEKWLNGKVSGSNEKDPQHPSKYVRDYMFEEANYKCTNCGWSKRNIYSNTIPLELDHIDGHSENNKKENLRVLCKCCHSLTPFYGTLNKGNGRRKFRELYRKENGLQGEKQ